jgi:hypothetical protein
LRSKRTHVAAAAAALSLACLLTGCGGDDDSSAADDGAAVSAPATQSEDDAGDASGDAAGSTSEACFSAFPMGGGMTPDLGDTELVPDDFPDPPVPATLCAITGTGEVGENLGYVSEATPEEVVAGYLEAFAPYGAVSEDGGHGVTAYAGDVKILVIPGFGKYEIQLDRQ